MTKKNKSTKRLLASIVLSFQSIVIFFATLTAFGLKMSNPENNLPSEEAIWGIGLSFALLAIITPALLRSRAGYWIGWIIQAALLVSGFWLWGMFLIGIILVGLWIWALVAGGTIDKARENYKKLMGEQIERDPSSN
jgi:nitric oxide reductase large subunit